MLERLRREHELKVKLLEYDLEAAQLRVDAARSAAAEAERLRRVVLELPDDLRFAVTARFWAELPLAEIAQP